MAVDAGMGNNHDCDMLQKKIEKVGAYDMTGCAG